MLDVLSQVERLLPSLLHDEGIWHDLFIDYHPPVVERLWTSVGEHRVSLHRIHSCLPHEALFHPHPWPSAMRILGGTYEMRVGYSVGDTAPPVAALLHLPTGSTYVMCDPNGWHSVRPLGEPVWSVMVTGKPWGRSKPDYSDGPLSPLPTQKRAELFAFFRRHCLKA